ncbi:aspartyl-phosphate phosphatase Spo0E family protein [Halobacillus amylolyticus]|uniref:Aspartyl-phosphate phosphatase Spo0E family protein n=1 Tax=Halobacillus amylolyticus TaxID=2932259 RepID=A0ABY4H9V2_9BACI|nr:aspartyl-phosphate phosphatase Spo0E family protein [Halobacillus amylolyticus]UOR11389.1 aspartyl-phosphate phosphatase Spo0E family protein [Halobacillus amylolyticus]
MENELQKEIEHLREELYDLYTVHKTMAHPQVICLSQLLDEKISTYQKMNVTCS